MGWFCWMLALGVAAAQTLKPQWGDAGLSADGLGFAVEVPEFMQLRAHYGAVVLRGGERFDLRSQDCAGSIPQQELSEETPFGREVIQQRVLSYPQAGCELWFRWGQVSGLPGTTVRVGVRNTGSEALQLLRTTPMAMEHANRHRLGERVFLTPSMAKSIVQPLGKVHEHLSANQETLRLAGEPFSRGIGCHAPSEMVFALEGNYDRFQSVVGMDDAGNGSGTFEVHLDGVKVFDSGMLLRGQPGVVINLDVRGKRELRLVTTDGGDGTYYDWADWCHASLLRGIDGSAADEALPAEPHAALELRSGLTGWAASPMIGQGRAFHAPRLDRLFEPMEIREAAGIYHSSGHGLFIGPIGDPVAEVLARVSNIRADAVALEVTCDMDSVQVAPGQLRWSQQIMLCVDGAQTAQQRWVTWVANTHRARHPKPPMSGWLSWYWLGQHTSEADVQSIIDFTARVPSRLQPAVIQLDDGYQRGYATLEWNERFPSGGAAIAQRIAARGAMAGLMINAAIDSPAAMEHTLRQIRQAVEQGFRYLKIYPRGSTDDPAKTRFEERRAALFAMREAAGNDTYLLVAETGMDRACVGAVDAKRIRSSTDRNQLPDGMADAVLSLPLNRQWFTIDTDCYYLADGLPGLPSVAGGTTAVQTWLGITAMGCGNAMTSEPWHWQRMAPYLRQTEMLTPPARESVQVLDLGSAAGPSCIVGTVRRPWGEWMVALLWNPGLQPKEVSLDFAKAGLDPNRRYAVWSFWDHRFLGVVQRSWTTPVLLPLGSQLLRLTPLDENADKPQLVGSNFHLWSGAVEFEQLTSLHGAMELRLSDGGARAGDVFIRCSSEPQVRSASGCRVSQISATGDDIWKLSITARQRGVPQWIELGLHVPVTRQPWFWALSALVLTSVAFGLWRYVETLRIERQVEILRQKSALDEERARIARDLHDDLGASIARIGLLTELADPTSVPPEKTRAQLAKILLASKHLARQLDAIVWSVDPANDMLESLARYLHGQAEDYLAVAGIRCRFEAPADLPEIQLSSPMRHHVLMVVKEALHNVVKHSGAQSVLLRLSHAADALTIQVIDDGRGCKSSNDGRRRGNGLNNMLKRAQSAGGTLEVGPGPDGRGTEVRLTIPYTTHPS